MATPEPVFGLTYGPSGCGKTTDMLYSFPRALFISPPGALRSGPAVCGYTPRTAKTEAQSIMEVTATLEKNGAEMRKLFPSGIVIDDFSLLAERTMGILENKYTGHKFWGALRSMQLDLRDAARRAGVHVFVNAHLQPPTMKPDATGLNAGKYVRGGPRLPGRMPEDFPTACDLVLRVEVDQTGRRGWAGTYRCNVLDTDYSTKDRDDVTPVISPMNVGEIMRLGGHDMPRLAELPWQEEVVEKGAQALMGTTSPAEETEVLRALASACIEKYKAIPQHTAWTVRDAFDRMQLRRSKAGKLARLYQL